MQDAEKTRETVRKKKAQDNVETRKKQASRLMGTILAEQTMLPKPEPTWAWDEVPVGGKSKKRDTSPRSKTSARTRTPGKSSRKTSTAPRARFVSPSPVRGERGYDEDRLQVEPDRYLNVRDKYDTGDRKTRMRGSGSGRMERSGTGEFAGTMRTSDGLRAYTKHLENMDTGEWQDITPRHSTGPVPRPRAKPSSEPQREQEPVPAPRPYKPKPFTKMVRLQRPETTRGRQARPKPTPYVDRLGQLSNTGSTARSGDTRREQERLFGK